MAGETILIVEDRRESIVHLANNILKPNGYQVLTAMDGQRGLKRILADKPDLVILDLNLPKMDGLEVLKALQERRVTIPVILSTFYGSEQVAEQALRLGAVDYVVKPYRAEDMLRAIESALQHRPAARTAMNGDQSAHPVDGPMPLTRQLERWVRDMNILTRVGKALVALLDEDRICIRSVEAAIYIIRADYAFLFMPQPQGSHLTLCAIRGPYDQRARLLGLPLDSRFALQVMQRGEALVQPRAPSDVAMFEVVGRPLGPIAGAPLHRAGYTIGVLVAAREPGGAPFNEGDIEWLGGLADYASIALRNARACQYLARSAQPTGLKVQQLDTLRRELEQLRKELQTAAETVQKLGELLESR